jgi:hypothetical protein
MEKPSPASIPPGTAREQLRDARRAHDASMRRAETSPGFILALSALCGAQTLAPASRGPGDILSIIAVAWFLAELVMLSAAQRWRPLRSWPKPKWGTGEALLISVAVLAGGVVGPHLLASRSHSAAGSWGLAVAVAVVVAACLFAAQAWNRRRAARAWTR